MYIYLVKQHRSIKCFRNKEEAVAFIKKHPLFISELFNGKTYVKAYIKVKFGEKLWKN